MSVILKSGRDKNGFTLTELAIVLGIFGAVLGSIWVAYGRMHYNRLVQQEMNDLLTIETGIQALYQGQPFNTSTFTNITTNLVPENIFPSDLPLNASGYPLNRENGVIDVEEASNSPVAGPMVFEVEFYGTPTTCQQLAYEMSQMRGATAPLYVFDSAHGWQATPNTPGAPNNALTPASFAGCTYASFAFGL